MSLYRMPTTRRVFLGGAAVAAMGGWAQGGENAVGGGPAGEAQTPAGESGKGRLRIGMCDWSMGKQTPDAFTLGHKIGLDGLQVSFGTLDNRMWLRRPEIQAQYLEAARTTGMAIASLGLVELNNVPLMSEPRAAVWLDDAIEVAAAMKVPVILLAFFSKGELKAENTEDMRRVTEVLAEVAPKAEKAGVILGVESYLSAEDHLKILDQIKSPAVQVYYDVYNSHVTKGYDFVHEIRLLGRQRICEIHFKDGPNYLGEGRVEWPRVATVLREIGYDRWIVLETSSPSGDLVADTRRNLEYVRRLLST